ncbi:hypothetical protein [Rheinheimera sp.]|uniref:hypothetical protein n=1 Tax=Rheinheimera TaxID=67575 RepID=UPI002352EC89|nr:hypothetical protein [Rheinheimera sp.]
MKLQQCPTCEHKLDLKRAAATKKVNGIFLLQCPNCYQWSYENRNATIVKKIGLLTLLGGAVMGYFQIGGVIYGPLIAIIGGSIALMATCFIPRIPVSD